MSNDWLTIRSLDAESLSQFNIDYETVLLQNPAGRELAYQSWHSFFLSQGSEIDWQYQDSFFGWYTDLTWMHLKNVSETTVIKMAFGRQVPVALWRGIDVWKELMFYLDGIADPQLIESVYGKIQQEFFNSLAIVGVWKEKKYTVADLVKDVRLVGDKNVDSLRSAETLSKVRQILSQNESRYLKISVDENLDRLVGLINFFLGVEPTAVWFVVDGFINPEKYEVNGKILNEPEKEVGQQQVDSTNNRPAANYGEIKTMIEARFARDASGEFVNLDGVLALLDSLATDQGDDQIRELYYFDEGVGKFQWNQVLLT